MRGSARREVVIDVPAAEAWRVVGRPELLHHWFPGIVDCRVAGDTRTIVLATGLSLVERILTNDPLQRRFQYRIAGGFFAEHLASVDVIALSDRSCLVIYASDAAPATMAIVLGGAMAAALAELRRQLEAGAGPAMSALVDGATEVAGTAVGVGR
jgi:carbon monoxide dehydrogenase subunit G